MKWLVSAALAFAFATPAAAQAPLALSIRSDPAATSDASMYEVVSLLEQLYAACQALARLAGRHMRLQCTIQEGQVWIGTESHSFHFEMGRWQIAVKRGGI